MDRRFLSRLGLALSIIGVFILLYVYVAIIVFGDILYNPLTNNYIPLVLMIPFVRYLNAFQVSPQALKAQLLVGDIILFAALIMAIFGSLLYYYFKTKSLKRSFGKTIFNYSVLVALLVFVPVFVVSQSLGHFLNIPPYKVGMPQWTFSVTSSTCFVKMPDWSNYSPYCYFVNYEEILVVSIIAAVIGYLVIRKS